MVFSQEDYEQVQQHFANIDSVLHFILVKHGYLPPTPKRNLFAILVGSIIGRRVRFEKARSLRRALYLRCGTNDFYPTDILNLGLPELRACGIDKTLAETILRLTTHLIEHQINLVHISDLNNLRKIKGIGPWTLACTKIMFSLNEDESTFDDTLLHTDLIIKRALKQIYGWTTPDQIIAGTSAWSPWKGILTVYLWKEFSK